jgi:hypothetical protein
LPCDGSGGRLVAVAASLPAGMTRMIEGERQ